MPKSTPTGKVTSSNPEAETSSIVWILDSNQSCYRPLIKELCSLGIACRSLATAQEILTQERPGALIAILVSMAIPDMDYRELMDRLQSRHPEVPIIVITDSPILENAVNAFHEGAFEYLTRKFNLSEAIALIRRAQAQTSRTGPTHVIAYNNSNMIGDAPAMHDIFRTIARLNRSEVNVFIYGESGTGKGITAKALHRYSPLTDKQFISLNIAAIPPELLESELFGSDAYAAQNSQNRRIGRLEQADGGTLFLDDISDLPLELQNRLLRVLIEGEFYPVSSSNPIKINVRIIAATQKDMDLEIAEGRFREDLYHRLNLVQVHLPPLRDRRQDIPLLMRHFLKASSHELKVESKELHPDVENYLCTLDWSGNVRQLENTCRWITAVAVGKQVFMSDLPPDLLLTCSTYSDSQSSQWESIFRRWVQSQLQKSEPNVAKVAIESAEAILIETALEVTQGRREEAAKLLGYGRNTVTRKISELNLNQKPQLSLLAR